MSSFEVKVYKLEILTHPNADSLELAKVGDYLSIVRKDLFKTGDLAVYIPEASLVPEEILKEIGLDGKLAGSKKNRVRAMKLRGILSQGLIYPNKGWGEGQDVTKELNITKWEPEIPAKLAGEVNSWDGKFSFDVENIKKYPSVFANGEDVIITEKIHGSCMLVALVPTDKRKDDMIDGKFVVISKGLGAQGLYFKDTEKNNENSYVKTARESGLLKQISDYFSFVESEDDKEFLFVGELVGVQDMKYGVTGGALTFRLFGLRVNGDWIDWDILESVAIHVGMPMVPVLYRGPFSKEALDLHTNGKESVTGQEMHIREGVVVYPAKERYSAEMHGRTMLKSVSEAYLLRKEGTEFT